MSKLLLFVALIAILVVSSTHLSLAHTLTTDEKTAVIVHVDPDDDPYVGVPSTISFEIRDPEGEFDLRTCNCELRIEQEGKLITSIPIESDEKNTDSTHSFLSYTFPTKGIYTLSFVGTPKEDHAFEPFSIHSDLRVQREIQETSPANKPDSLLQRVLTTIVKFLRLSSLSGKQV